MPEGGVGGDALAGVSQERLGLGGAEERRHRAASGWLRAVRGRAGRRVLGRLYAAARLHGNLFQPSFKLREKRRESAQMIKRHHAPEPPATRALAHATVSDADKTRLRDMLGDADPVLLLAEIQTAKVT